MFSSAAIRTPPLCPRFLYAFVRRKWGQAGIPDLSEVSPAHFPEQFATPILLVHGKRDLRVPVSQSRRMADALKAAGKSFEYLELPLGDHRFSRQADRLEFLEAVESFLKKYNPAA